MSRVATDVVALGVFCALYAGIALSRYAWIGGSSAALVAQLLRASRRSALARGRLSLAAE